MYSHEKDLNCLSIQLEFLDYLRCVYKTVQRPAYILKLAVSELLVSKQDNTKLAKLPLQSIALTYEANAVGCTRN